MNASVVSADAAVVVAPGGPAVEQVRDLGGDDVEVALTVAVRLVVYDAFTGAVILVLDVIVAGAGMLSFFSHISMGSNCIFLRRASPGLVNSRICWRVLLRLILLVAECWCLGWKRSTRRLDSSRASFHDHRKSSSFSILYSRKTHR